MPGSVTATTVERGSDLSLRAAFGPLNFLNVKC
jgi:hypothetical protein